MPFVVYNNKVLGFHAFDAGNQESADWLIDIMKQAGLTGMKIMSTQEMAATWAFGKED